MNFDNRKVSRIISKIPQEQLLVIDWKIHAPKNTSVVYQNFGEPVYNCLSANFEAIKKYREFILYYPQFTYHPKEAIDSFEQFCTENEISFSVIYKAEEFKIKEGALYFLVSDRTLAIFLDQCSEFGFEPGNEVGVISYNETPMKKYVKNGITVISTDFELMGQKAAEFVTSNKPLKFEVPTKLTIRNSL